MTSRERVLRALHFEKPDRIPRNVWVLPGATFFQGENVARLQREFPDDFANPPVRVPALPHMKGDPHEVGTYIDAWGCEFTNLQRGVIGEVKKPLVNDWSELDKVRPPYACVGAGLDVADDFCRTSDRFVFGGGFNFFERMQFIRGTENLFMDFAAGDPEVLKLRDIVHRYNVAYLEPWLKTKVDGVMMSDDWGTQRSLLIRPAQWREIFKPCYAEYARMARAAGKYVFMHSDGYIFDIYEDLIEIGVHAINSQLFCMPIEEIGKRFKGRITFWGEMDRQHLLPHGTPDQIRQAVRRVYTNLSANGGGVIAQFEYGLEARYENARATFDEWQKAGT